jgi:hypothetical protein
LSGHGLGTVAPRDPVWRRVEMHEGNKAFIRRWFEEVWNRG